MHISIQAETLFHLFGFPVTNSIILGTFGILFLIGWMMFVASKAKRNIYTAKVDASVKMTAENPHDDKSRKFQRSLKTEERLNKERKRDGFFTRLALWAFEGLYKTVHTVIPNKKVAKQVAPFAISIFFVVMIQYYTGILPIVGEVITFNGTPLFRPQAADLNFTFMLAIVTIVATQVWAVKVLGFRGNLGRYFINPFKDPVGSFAGILELIGEFSRIVSLSMRLFGNVFAGEVLLVIVAYLTSFGSPALLPFLYIFELFIGGIQAYVFFMLATVFVGLAVSHGDHQKSDHSAESKQLSEAKV
ncbi:F0F1 ATP synthase subunit A [Candidatus Saccharibacteria bacterium]|nr:F0F1 ATP synthase subunit A [Candidatus Saccharibacteria bacterium]